MRQAQPLLRVVRGEPTEEELAALVAVTLTRPGVSGPAAGDRDASPSAWLDRGRLVRRTLPHGPGAWRASAWRS